MPAASLNGAGVNESNVQMDTKDHLMPGGVTSHGAVWVTGLATGFAVHGFIHAKYGFHPIAKARKSCDAWFG